MPTTKNAAKKKRQVSAPRKQKEKDLHEVLLETAKGRWSDVIKGVVDDAAAGDNNARKLLLDHLNRQTLHAIPVSTPMPNLPLAKTEDAVASQQFVVGKVAAGELGMREGKELAQLIQMVIDSQTARLVNELRAEIDEIRRLAQGGGRIIDQDVEVRPKWGRAALRRTHDS
jgi:hypothetical protein